MSRLPGRFRLHKKKGEELMRNSKCKLGFE